MTQEIEKHKQEANNRSLFDYATEVAGWLQIVASPLLLAIFLAVCVYVNSPTTTGLVLAIGITLTGLITGIIFATRVWKKQGTIHFMSGIMSTPEPGGQEEEKK